MRCTRRQIFSKWFSLGLGGRVEVVAGLSLKNWRPRVWDRRSPEFIPRLRAVMLSFDEFRRQPRLHREAMGGGLGAVLGDGASQGLKLYLDNGAFACLTRRRRRGALATPPSTLRQPLWWRWPNG